jgi:pilus assembly protein CpaB
MQGTADLATALHRAADRGRRTGLRAALFLALAVLAAVGSALLLTRYMDARTEAVRVPTVGVVVAAAELPAGTELQAEHLRVVRWPESSRPEGAFEAAAPLLGKVVGARIYRSEPILPGRLASARGGLSALLPAGMRAAAVRVDDVMGVAGFIHPGDAVDVIVTLRPEAGRAATSSKVILQNIRVLSVGAELDGESRRDGGAARRDAPGATVATLQVDAEQSERLALAAAQGKLLLTLRSAADAELVATKGMTPAALLELPRSEPPPPKPVTRVIVREPEKKADVVEILRGDLWERRNFDQAAGQKR